MERNLKAIIRLDVVENLDLNDAIGCAVDATGALGGDYGVVLEAIPGAATVGLFGGNTGPVEVKLAGTVERGDFLARDASTGRFAVAAAGAAAEARAIEAGVAEELVAAILLPPAAAAATA